MKKQLILGLVFLGGFAGTVKANWAISTRLGTISSAINQTECEKGCQRYINQIGKNSILKAMYFENPNKAGDFRCICMAVES